MDNYKKKYIKYKTKYLNLLGGRSITNNNSMPQEPSTPVQQGQQVQQVLQLIPPPPDFNMIDELPRQHRNRRKFIYEFNSESNTFENLIRTNDFIEFNSGNRSTVIPRDWILIRENGILVWFKRIDNSVDINLHAPFLSMYTRITDDDKRRYPVSLSSLEEIFHI